MFMRSAARNLIQQGLIRSPYATAGRTDKLPISVFSGSSIVPADVVSGLGQGNTDNGVAILQKMFSTGPYGTKLPGRSRTSMPRLRRPRMRAEGGNAEETDNTTQILASDGEFVVNPESVAMIGNGDIDRGHKILNEFYTQARARNVKELKKMGPPHD